MKVEYRMRYRENEFVRMLCSIEQVLRENDWGESSNPHYTGTVNLPELKEKWVFTLTRKEAP